MKILNLITAIFIFALISTTTSIAQETVTELNLLTESASIEMMSAKKVVNTPTSKKYVPFSLDPAAYGINASKDFGSFIIPSTNYLKIVASDDVIYNKAQMVNKESGENVFTVELEGIRNTVDMTGTPAGIYVLILTNGEGKIYKENIMIM